MSILRIHWVLCITLWMHSHTVWAAQPSKTLAFQKQKTKKHKTAPRIRLLGPIHIISKNIRVENKQKNTAKKTTQKNNSKRTGSKQQPVQTKTIKRPVVARPATSRPVLKAPKRSVLKVKTLQPTRRPTSRPILKNKEHPIKVTPTRALRIRWGRAFTESNALNLQEGASSSNVSTVGTPNWFILHVRTSDWYVLQTKGKSDSYCTLYTMNQAPLESNDDSGERRNCRIIRKLKKGKYALRIHLLPSKKKRFSVQFKRLSRISLRVGSSTKGHLTWPGDMQMYAVHVKKPGWYRIETQGKADTVCIILSPSDTFRIRARDDDSGPKRNCSLFWYFERGQHNLFVTGSYSGKGPYTLKYTQERPPAVQFKALSWGKLHKTRLAKGETHRYRFTLSRKRQVIFVTQMLRSNAQMLLLNANGKIIDTQGYNFRAGRTRIFSKFLPAGDYDLQLHSTSKKRSQSYIFFAQKEKLLELPANRSRLTQDGAAIQRGTNSGFMSAFRVQLKKDRYNVLYVQGKQVVGCVLESTNGNVIQRRKRIQGKRTICSITTWGQEGTFVFRILSKRKRKTRPFRRRRRLSYAQRRRLRRRRFLRLLRRLRRRRRLRRNRRRWRHFRNLYRPRVARPKKPKKVVPKPRIVKKVKPHVPRVHALMHSYKDSHVRFISTRPQALHLGKAQRVSYKGSAYFQIDVARSDLYWFSTRGGPVKHCSLESIRDRKIRQMSIFPTGCDVAAYLIRGSYMLRVHTSKRSRYNLVWRAYRTLPKALFSKAALVGPVRKNQTHNMRITIRTSGFYSLTMSSASMTPIRVYALLKQGRAIRLKPKSRRYGFILEGFLKSGVYKLVVKVTQGLGAYRLAKRKFPTFKLKINTSMKNALRDRSSRHFYTFSASKTGWYTIGTLGHLDSVCSLFNTRNRKIARNDDTGPGRNCLIIKRLQRGKYTIRVRQLHRKKRRYSIRVRSITARAARLYMRKKRRRYGRRRYPARTLRSTIHVNRSYTNIIRAKNDTHIYTVRIQRAGRYTFETKGPANRTDTKCYIYKGARRIAYNDDSGYRLHCKVRARLTPGVYQIRIKLALSTRAGPYQFSIRPSHAAWPVLRGRRLIPSIVRRARRRSPRLGIARRRTRTLVARRTGNNAVRMVAARAMTLRPGLRTQSMIVSSRRIDAYNVRIPIAGMYTITTDGNIDTKCYLDDARGHVLFANEDGGSGANCQIRGRLASGVYTLRVLARPVGYFKPYGLTLQKK